MNPVRPPLSPRQEIMQAAPKSSTKSKLNFRFAQKENAERDEQNTNKKVTDSTKARTIPVPSSGYGQKTSKAKGKLFVQSSDETSAGNNGGGSPRRDNKAAEAKCDEQAPFSRSPANHLTTNDARLWEDRSAKSLFLMNAKMVDKASSLLSNQDTIEKLVERKVTGSKFEYKARSDQSSKLISGLKRALVDMAAAQRSFVHDAVGIESTILSAYEASVSECNELRLTSDTTQQEKEAVSEELATTKKLNESHSAHAAHALAQLDESEKRLSEIDVKAATLEAGLRQAEGQAASLEKRCGELESAAGVATKTHEERVTGLSEQLSRSTQVTKDQSQDLADLRAAHSLTTTRLQTTQAELSEKTQAIGKVEITLALSSKDSEILTIKLDSVKEQLSMALTSSRMLSEREAQLNETAHKLEQELRVALAEAHTWKDGAAQLRSDAALLNAEHATCKALLEKATRAVDTLTVSESEARVSAREASEALLLEKELRSRAEVREEEERRERTAACAHLIAQTKAHEGTLQQQRAELSAEVQSANARTEVLRRELEVALESARSNNEQVVVAQGETATLRSLLEHERSNVEELVAMARQNGEMGALRHRMEELSAQKSRSHSEAQQRIAELEEEVRAGEECRRKLHNTIQELRGNVRVFARVRPFLPGDAAPAEAESAITVKHDGASLGVCNKDGESLGFTFDKSFPPSAGQEVVFTEVSEFVQSALDGYNVCLFSYGQTGSGKTHTMQGVGTGNMRGIIPRAMQQVAEYKSKLVAQGWQYTMRVSFVEIYCEKIRDLLRSESLASSSSSSASCPHEKPKITRNSFGANEISGVAMVEVDPSDDAAIAHLIEEAGRTRTTTRTDMNDASSRSHSVFTLHLTAVNPRLNAHINGQLNLCDLAGSERVDRSGVTGVALTEAKNINKSLSALAGVFESLSKNQGHIPFRDSTLTYLLEPALSGNGKTLMIVNLSPTEDSVLESVSTLRFGAKVNKIELGKPKRQVDERSSSAVGGSKKIGKR